MEAIDRSVLDVGVASFTLPGQHECGDRHVIMSFPGGVLAAVIDGVGHGVEAAKAAKITERLLKSCAHEPLGLLVKRCHEALRGTRGVVMSLASFNPAEKTMTWVGVGNVEGQMYSVSTSKPRPLLLFAGILGHQTGPAFPTVLSVNLGDTLIFVTDGIREDFAQGLNLKQPPQQLADGILACSARQTDDALVLVGRYLR